MRRLCATLDALPQLGFPWCEEALRCEHVEQLHGHVTTLKLEVRVGLDEIALALSTHSIDTFELRLRLAHPAGCRVNGTSSSWDMEQVRACGLLPLPFDSAVEWADERLVAGTPNSPIVDAAIKVAEGALSRCDRAARNRALPFADDVRLFVYSALVGDSTTRTEQMIHACPGLLILASVHPEIPIRDGIVQGERLPRLLRELGIDSHRMALVRRAPAAISTAQLRSVLKAPGVDINDTPISGESWYQAVATVHTQQTRLPQESRRDFGGFVSKHGLELARLADQRGWSVSQLLDEVLDWIVFAGQAVPTRRSTPERVLDGVELWHQALWQGCPADPSIELPQPSVSATIDGVELTPLRNVADLVSEGANMRHCVATYYREAIEERVFVYRGTVGGQRVTVAIAPQHGGWRLVDAAGLANQPLQAPDLLAAWMAALRPNRHAG